MKMRRSSTGGNRRKYPYGGYRGNVGRRPSRKHLEILLWTATAVVCAALIYAAIQM
jgi:hypothetical protein